MLMAGRKESSQRKRLSRRLFNLLQGIYRADKAGTIRPVDFANYGSVIKRLCMTQRCINLRFRRPIKTLRIPDSQAKSANRILAIAKCIFISGASEFFQMIAR